jgi:hypothetical protein
MNSAAQMTSVAIQDMTIRLESGYIGFPWLGISAPRYVVLAP